MNFYEEIIQKALKLNIINTDVKILAIIGDDYDRKALLNNNFTKSLSLMWIMIRGYGVRGVRVYEQDKCEIRMGKIDLS